MEAALPSTYLVESGAVHAPVGVHTAVLVTSAHELKGILHYLTAHLILIYGFMRFFHNRGITEEVVCILPSAGADLNPALFRSSQHLISLALITWPCLAEPSLALLCTSTAGRLYLHYIGGPGLDLCLLYSCLAVHRVHHPQSCTQAHKLLMPSMIPFPNPMLTLILLTVHLFS